MSDMGLKFGPEWMRALSAGGGGTNTGGPGHNSGQSLLKSKPAAPEHRFNRKEMLALCVRAEVPPEYLLNDPAAICGDPECTVPLAYTPLTQEEQRMWQRNINSESAVRLLNSASGSGGSGGRGGGGGGGGGVSAALSGGPGSNLTPLGGGGGPVSRGRGSSMDRGRGRARGMPGGGQQYYMRGLSYEEEAESGRGANLRDGLAPPGMGMRRGGSVGGYERSSSLSTLGALPSGAGGGSGSEGRSGSMGAWGVPPNIASDHHPASQSGAYHVSSSGQGGDHAPGGRGSMQGEERLGGASSPRKEQGRASTENWRNRDLSAGGGAGLGGDSPSSAPNPTGGPTTSAMPEHWRAGLTGSSSLSGCRPTQDKWGTARGSSSNGWRPRDPVDDGLGGGGAGSFSYGGGYGSRGRGATHHQPPRTRQFWDSGNTRRNWTDDDRLPEWATDIYQETRGSFDSTGAFHSPAWSGGDDDYLHQGPTGGGGTLLSLAGSGRSRQKSGSLGPAPSNDSSGGGMGSGSPPTSSSMHHPPPSSSSSVGGLPGGGGDGVGGGSAASSSSSVPTSNGINAAPGFANNNSNNDGLDPRRGGNSITSDDRGDLGRSGSSSSVNGGDQHPHSSSLGNRRRPPNAESASSQHASESQKRLSEALELNLNSNDGVLSSSSLMNGYGDRGNDVGGGSHDGSSSPMVAPDPSNSGGEVDQSAGRHQSAGGGGPNPSSLAGLRSVEGGSVSSTAPSHHHNMPQMTYTGSISDANLSSQSMPSSSSHQQLGNGRTINSFSSRNHNAGGVGGPSPSDASGPHSSSVSVTHSMADTIGNSVSGEGMRTLRRELSHHGSLVTAASSSQSRGASKDDRYREEELEHMQSVADDLVSKLVDEEPNSQHQQQKQLGQPQQLVSLSSLHQGLIKPCGPPAGFQPLPELSQHTIDTEVSWYYTDPQQEVQGPFSAMTMTSWYNSGYFSDKLLLRRDCDDKFALLGDLKRVFGRVPFLPGPPVPPLKLSKLMDSQDRDEVVPAVTETEQRQRIKSPEDEEYERALQAYTLKKKMYDHQLQYRKTQVLQQLTRLDSWNSLPPSSQQQLFIQQLLVLPTLQEPVPPSRGAFLTSNTSSTSNLVLPNLLSLPSTVQQQQQQLSQVSYAAAAVSGLQQDNNSCTTNLTSSLLVQPSVAGGSGLNSMMQQLQIFQQHREKSRLSSNASLLHHQLQQQPPEHHQKSQQLPPQQQTEQPAKDPIQDFVEQMTSASTAPKSTSPLLATGSLLNTSDPTTSMSHLLQQSAIGGLASSSSLPLDTSSAALPAENPLQQLLMKFQRDNSGGAPTTTTSTAQSNGGSAALGLATTPTSNKTMFQQNMSVPPPNFPQRQQSGEDLTTGTSPPGAASLLSSSSSSTMSSLSGAPGLQQHDIRQTQVQQQQQEDVIQSFMQQLTKMHMQNDQTSEAQEIGEQRRPEEDSARQQNKKADEDKRKHDTPKAKKDQDDAGAKKKAEEDLKKKEEQKRRDQEEDHKKKVAESKRKEEEKKSKQKLKQQEEANKRQEEKRRQHEEESKRKAEEKRRDQEAREAAEQLRRQQEEMRRIALEEERKRMHQIEQEELAKQALQQQQEAAARHLQQQQQAAWGAAAATLTSDCNNAQSTPSLLEIQKLQQEKDRLERESFLKEEETRRQEAAREAVERKKAAPMTLKWASKQGGGGNSVKSLLQIQAEEEKEMKKRATREQQESKAAAAAAAAASLGAASHGGNSSNVGGGSSSGGSGGSRVWGGTAPPLSWASRASTNTAPPPAPASNNQSKNWNDSSFPWTASQQQSSGGFWESSNNENKAVGGKTAAAVAARAPANKPAGGAKPLQQQNKQNKNSAATTAAAKQNKLNAQTNNNNNNTKAASKKKGKEEEVVAKKNFIENSSNPSDEFRKWCTASLVSFKVTAGIDVPTFVNFLGDVESPYEVHDYIRSYLGDTREVKDFAKNYLERRSQVNNATRQKTVPQDDIFAPAPAINPGSENFQDGKKHKQKNKKKMQKVDSSILGFNVNSKDRMNGEDSSA